MRGARQLMLDLFGAAPPATAAGAADPTAAAPTPDAAAPALPLPQVLAPVRFVHPRASHEIAFARAHVAYEFRRGRRRSIGFSVNADGLTVSAPRWTPLAEVESALRHKERWIVAKLGEARERHERLESMRIDWREGATIAYLGAPLTLVLDPRQRHGRGGAVLDADAEAPAGTARPSLHLGLPRSASAEQLRDATQAWLMRQARRVFTQRLDHFAPQLQVRWQRLGLSSAGTRWGSASADGAIRLNWRLIHFSQPVIDYVVVHELAHLREMNHSPRFWQHVESVLPDYAERRRALKDEPLPRW